MTTPRFTSSHQHQRSADRLVVRGFADMQDDDLRPDGCLRWYQAPPHDMAAWRGSNVFHHTTTLDHRQQQQPAAATAAPATAAASHDNSLHAGHWSVDALQQLTLVPPAKKDYWRQTFYQPRLVKDDGPLCYCEIPEHVPHTVEVSFTLTACRQFDQAGVMLRLDHTHWIKAGIEVVDNLPRLSCVVTNIYSDWSTQPWPEYKQVGAAAVAAAAAGSSSSSSSGRQQPVHVTCRLKLHCRGQHDFVVETKQRYQEWQFIRICHCDRNIITGDNDDDEPPEEVAADLLGSPSGPPPGSMWVGVFGCCPQDQDGSCSVTFTTFQVSQGSRFDHNADGNL